MHCAIRVRRKRRLPERQGWLRLAKCRRLALLFYRFLLPPALWGAAQVDSDPVQQSLELMSTSDLVGAEKEARLALRDSSTRPGAWTALGMIRARQKKYVEATEFFQNALRLDPGLVLAHLSLGEVDALTGKREQAREQFQRVLRTDPGNREGLLALAQLESTSGNFSASLRVAEPILAGLRQSSA